MKKILFSISFVFLIGCEISQTEDVPVPPGELVTKMVSKDQVDLNWKDNSTNETGFKIERKIDSGTFSEIGNTSQDITTFYDKTVSLNTTYTYRVYSFNKGGKSSTYSNEVTIKTINVPTISTVSITQITSGGANSGGTITSDGNSAITARGIVWGTASNPTIELPTKTINGNGIGTFQSALTGLTGNTKYFVRAYATNIAGTSYGNEISFTTPAEPVFTFNTVIGANGRIWMDRNLGASRVATSSNDAEARGDLYQWGRGADGHQKRTSTITNTLSSIDKPVNGNFIISPNAPFDWRIPQNSNLWQGVNGVNNPCPSGFRLPTIEEWEAEMNSWSSKTMTGAFQSKLKLVGWDYRQSFNGAINDAYINYNGLQTTNYWSSTINGEFSMALAISQSPVSGGISRGYAFDRANGLYCRCIKN